MKTFLHDMRVAFAVFLFEKSVDLMPEPERKLSVQAFYLFAKALVEQRPTLEPTVFKVVQ